MRKYLIAGLLIWIPLGVTVMVVKLLVDIMDRTLLLLPAKWQPDALLGIHIPGLGVVLSVVVVLVTGIVVANFLGRRLVAMWEYLLSHIPFVAGVYRAAKQVMEAVLSTGGQSFRKVMLIEYPRKGIWCLSFLTGSDFAEIDARTGKQMVSVFVPTTPNPTSGFVILMPREDVIELDMSVDDGLKMIISLGVAVPVWEQQDAPDVAEIAAAQRDT